MLTKKQLLDAVKCDATCQNCSLIRVGEYKSDCIPEIAKTALAYREMLERIQFLATQVYDNDHIAEDCCSICGGQGYHEDDCELAALLKGE